jgi:heterotetrameric sarcosine oxidase delta subunit
MLLIPCPWCGARDEVELTDGEWADFLFVRDNPRGPWSERWFHTAGCRRWFNVVRDTATYEIRGSYRIGEEAP